METFKLDFDETMESINSFEQLMVDVLKIALNKYNKKTCSNYKIEDFIPNKMEFQSETEIYYEFLDEYGSHFDIVLTEEDF
jgi:hypothetical protein